MEGNSKNKVFHQTFDPIEQRQISDQLTPLLLSKSLLSMLLIAPM